ncbi:MAG: hydrogenase maturation protease [Candidatus Cloacimonadota bacterium]|nr:hydrogenase maturation protease [Candidatus Cloacimonadota bacterium]
MKLLIFGYGNPGLRDDGLGILFSEYLENWAKKNNVTNIDCDSNYQLNIEDADNISGYDIVIFVDATMEKINNFILTEVIPSDKTNFTTHSVSPEFVLNLCHQLTDYPPATYLLHIKGYEWNMQEELTQIGKQNFDIALENMRPLLEAAQKNNLEKALEILEYLKT